MKFKDKEYKKFVKFLTEGGVHWMDTTKNEYELLRFGSANGVGIVYRNKQNDIKFTGEATKAYEFFLGGKQYKAYKVVRRKPAVDIRDKLLERDGNCCFFCTLSMLFLSPEQYEMADFNTKQLTATVEHLLSVSHGGSNHLANLAFAHLKCNQLANNLSLVDKIKLRDKLTLEVMNGSTV